MTEGFTGLDLYHLLTFRSIYSMRIYEQLSRFNNPKSDGLWRVTLDDLREMLQLKGLYTNVSEFKSRVIERAQKDLIGSPVEFTLDYFKYPGTKKIKSISFKLKSRHIKPPVLLNDNLKDRLQALDLREDFITLVLARIPDVDLNRGLWGIEKNLEKKRKDGDYNIQVGGYAYAALNNIYPQLKD